MDRQVASSATDPRSNGKRRYFDCSMLNERLDDATLVGSSSTLSRFLLVEHNKSHSYGEGTSAWPNMAFPTLLIGRTFDHALEDAEVCEF